MNYYGDITEPPTRTQWEDWDYLQLNEHFPDLRLQNKIDPPEKIDKFLFLEGKYMYNCIKALQELEPVNILKTVHLELFKTKDANNYICIIKSYSLVRTGEIVELLKDYLTVSTDVIVIATKSLVEYQTANAVVPEYIIRSLCTGNPDVNELNKKYPGLEQPNLLTGVTAGILCLREFLDKPALVLVCYIQHPEDEDVKEIDELIQSLNIIPIKGKLERHKNVFSNLYT